MMRIEFIADGSDEAPLVIIYGCDPAAIRLLSKEVESLARGDSGSVIVNALAGYSGVDLIFERGVKDAGIVSEEDHRFFCRLTPETWTAVKERLSAFCLDASKVGPFTWVNESSEISLLVSTGCHW